LTRTKEEAKRVSLKGKDTHLDEIDGHRELKRWRRNGRKKETK
jgi:hypothetical protein